MKKLIIYGNYCYDQKFLSRMNNVEDILMDIIPPPLFDDDVKCNIGALKFVGRTKPSRFPF